MKFYTNDCIEYLHVEVKLLLVTVNNRLIFGIEILHDLSCHPILNLHAYPYFVKSFALRCFCPFARYKALVWCATKRSAFVHATAVYFFVTSTLNSDISH